MINSAEHTHKSNQKHLIYEFCSFTAEEMIQAVIYSRYAVPFEPLKEINYGMIVIVVGHYADSLADFLIIGKTV